MHIHSFHVPSVILIESMQVTYNYQKYCALMYTRTCVLQPVFGNPVILVVTNGWSQNTGQCQDKKLKILFGWKRQVVIKHGFYCLNIFKGWLVITINTSLW